MGMGVGFEMLLMVAAMMMKTMMTVMKILAAVVMRKGYKSYRRVPETESRVKLMDNLI